VTLVAVTKTFDAATVLEAAAAGLTHFGENRVQEAAPKIQAVGAARLAPTWHLVGHLQSNKAKQAVQLFDLIHTVDDAPLARKLDAAAAAAGKRQHVLVQVNVAGEAAKQGVAPVDLRSVVDAIRECPSLELRGLMTIPPYEADPERSRPRFEALRRLAESVAGWLSPDSFPGELSMGMTEDFEVAIEEGATLVRIGRGLFGERERG
jgi:pyridoxal phosphate enzyme (YggS family)